MTEMTTRFAFGGTPTESHDGVGDRWTGPDGEYVIDPQGCSGGTLNGGVSGGGDWSADPDALTQHVVDYFVSAGLPRCQLAGVQVNGGSTGRTVDLDVRKVAGFTVLGSLAYAHLDAQDLSTDESVCWPTIPGSVVADAKAFQAQLATPAGMAAYQALLPDFARGMPGEVQIQHSGALSVTGAPPQVIFHVTLADSDVTFDRQGQQVNLY
jgi:hypothetical protein